MAWPIFTLQETADYLKLPYSTIRGWARPTGDRAAVITALKPEGHQASVPFLGFAEAFVYARLRRSGVKEHRIREGVRAVRESDGLEYALATKRLWTDRAEVLLGGPEDDLMVPRTGQAQFRETVREQLELITFADDDEYAERIRLPQFVDTTVIVDPEVAFGSPTIEPWGVRVMDVVTRFWAGEPMRDISFDLGVPQGNVEEVIRAQTRKPKGLSAAA